MRVSPVEGLTDKRVSPALYQAQSFNPMTCPLPRTAKADAVLLAQARRQARFWFEMSGWRSTLVYADVFLSVASIVVYIMNTYRCGWVGGGGRTLHFTWLMARAASCMLHAV